MALAIIDCTYAGTGWKMNKANELIQKMLRPIGKKVDFRYPGNEGRKIGYLKDRAIIETNPGVTGIPYWDVVDLIEFPGEKEPLWIRVGYYRKPGKNLVWGSQTTLTETIGGWKKLLVQTATQKPWFRQLLINVIEELQRIAKVIQHKSRMLLYATC